MTEDQTPEPADDLEALLKAVASEISEAGLPPRLRDLADRLQVALDSRGDPVPLASPAPADVLPAPQKE